MTDEIYRYILGHLSVLSDEQLGKLNFKAGLSFVDHNIDGENAKKIKNYCCLFKNKHRYPIMAYLAKNGVYDAIKIKMEL